MLRKLTYIHIKHFPSVSVEVFESALLHKTVIFHWAWFFPACFESTIHKSVYFLDAIHREGIESCECIFGISDRFGCKWSKFLLWENHEKDIVRPDHTLAWVVRKLGIVWETERSIKFHWLGNVCDREIDEDLFHED